MTNWDRSFCVVRGYHQYCYPPPIAYDSQLRHRFAVVLHSYPEGTSDDVFDAEFFQELCKVMRACIECDAITIMLEDLGELHSLHELSGIYAGADELEREAPTEIFFREGARLTCMEQTQFGGLDIYTDSYTFSFYTSTDTFDVFAAGCNNLCNRIGIESPEVHTGVSTKLPFIPWYRKHLPLLGMKAW